MSDTEGIQPISISVKEAAKFLGISPWSMYQLLDAEGSPVESRYKGVRRLVSVESLRAYYGNLPVNKPEKAS